MSRLGDVREGTCYGRRDAKTYNKVKIAATERDEGRKVVLLHYARKLRNDNHICEFVVVNGPKDPGMKVYSRVPGTDPALQPLAFTGDPKKGTLRVFGLLDAILNGYKGEYLPDGREIVEEWVRTEEDGKYVFHAPASYQGGPIHWLHDKDLGDESLVHEQTKQFLFPTAAPTEDVQLSEV